MKSGLSSDPAPSGDASVVSCSQEVMLDPAKAAITGDGVADFCWPLSLDSLTALRDSFVPKLVSALRTAREQQQEGAVPAVLLSHHIVTEVMAVFQAVALSNSLSGRTVTWPAQSRLWRAFSEGTVPQPAPLVGRLRKGPKHRGPLLQRIAPLARRIAARRTAGHLHFKTDCPRGGTVSTRFTDPLILFHAATRDAAVTHVHHSYWFSAVPAEKPKHISIAPSLPKSILDAVADAFAGQGESLNDLARDYLEDYLMTTILLVDIHLDRLRKGKLSLPQELWTGSAGNIWDRILRQATREAGGKVTGHDHATGSGHFQNPWNYFLEFVALDSFATDHPAKADAARRQADPSLLLEDGLPDIQAIVVPRQTTSSHRSASGRPSGTGPKRVMYVSTLYTGETLHLLPLPADMVVLDWQARLLAKLSSWGFEVLHKPHPEGPAPPAKLAGFSGYRRLDAPFESVWNEADLLLFDYPSSTTFGFALRTTKPLVLIDAGQFDWLPPAARDLGQRCAMVPARFDHDNRMRVDWQVLREATERAPLLADDTAFREHFLES